MRNDEEGIGAEVPEGSDYGPDRGRAFADEPPPAYRDAPPDILAPIDADAPVSGHVPPPQPATSIADSPEHAWAAASALVYPGLRPIGTHGLRIREINDERLADEGARSHAQPILDEGPVGLPVAYAIRGEGFDAIVNGDHLLSWGVGPAAVRDAAFANLAAWSATAPWTDEVSGDRRLISSDSGDGWDAARILLQDVRDHLADELAANGRVLVGLPERHLLVAGTLRPGDEEFAALFGQFIVDNSRGADEPIDERILEIVDGRLVAFAR